MEDNRSRYGAPFLPTQVPEAFFEHEEVGDGDELENDPLLPPPADDKHSGAVETNDQSATKGGTLRIRRPQSNLADAPEKLKLAFDHPPKPTRARPKDLTYGGNRSFTSMLKARWKDVGIWLLLAILGVMWTYKAHSNHKHVMTKPIRLGQRIRWAAHYLSASSDKNGHFRYIARANGLSHPEEGVYHMTHHAWVLAALADYAAYEMAGEDGAIHRQDDLEVDVRDALVKGAQLLVNALQPPPEHSGTITGGAERGLGLWESRKGRTEEHASMAGSAMALVALIKANRCFDGPLVDVGVLRRIGEFLLHLQRRDSLFFRTVVIRDGKAGREGLAEHSSLGAYALLLLSGADQEEVDGRVLPSPSWLKAGVRAVMGLAHERTRTRHHDMHYKHPADHWYLEAAAELMDPDRPYLNRTLLPEWYQFTDHWEGRPWGVDAIRSTVTEHCEQLVHLILTDYELLPRSHHQKDSALYGALTLHGEAFFTAQRLRGLLAALRVFPPSRPLGTTETERDKARANALLRERVERVARRAGEYLATLQVTHRSNPMRGAFLRARAKMRVKLTAEAEEFDDRLNEVRMDVVADVLEALIQTRRLVLSHTAR